MLFILPPPPSIIFTVDWHLNQFNSREIGSDMWWFGLIGGWEWFLLSLAGCPGLRVTCGLAMELSFSHWCSPACRRTFDGLDTLHQRRRNEMLGTFVSF